MANLPETPTYGSGVYQLEVTDSVLGGNTGISNTQAQQLGNRTAYLKQHMDTAETNITSINTALGNKAPLASPALTGIPTAPTATAGTNTGQVATTAFVTAAISNLNVGQYAPIASPTFTGVPSAPTATAGTSTTQIATTAFATAADATVTSNLTTLINAKAPTASPTFTGVPAAPTATAGTNTTQLATTAFVTGAISTLNTSLTTSIGGKLSKTGDTGTGNFGINQTAASGIGLAVSGVDVDNDWALRSYGDMSIQAASTAAVDQAVLYFKKKDGTTQFAIAQDPSQVGGVRFYNNIVENVALIDNGGNFIGANIEANNTWTPTVSGTTTAGTATYTTRNGYYSIIGNYIHFQCRVAWTGHTGTGALVVTGLPNAMVNLPNMWSIHSVRVETTVANTEYQVLQTANSAVLYLYSRVTTGTTGSTGAAITAANDLIISGSYRYR